MDIGLIRMKYTPYGGAEVFVSRFIDELLKKGHKCHIFATKWDRDTREAVVLHKIRTFGPSFLRILSFAVNSYFAVRKANLDVILSFDRTFYQDIYRAGDGCHREWLIQRGKLISPLKRFITFLNPLHLIILYLEKRLLKDKRLKFIVANSIRGKDEIKRHYKLPEDKICVIYNGIDIKAFDLIDKNNIRTVYREKLNIKNETTLLFVGSGFERKGLKFLIEALGILKKNGYEGIKLIVVGKGNIAKYKDMSVKCGVEADVKFVGPAKDINPYYCAADIFALPSIYEPFSNACLEAMASGLPVVTSRINGASEILIHGKDGMIINDPVNPEEIAERIKPLLYERARQAAGKEARRTVENYTIGKNVDEFIKLIEKVKLVPLCL